MTTRILSLLLFLLLILAACSPAPSKLVAETPVAALATSARGVTVSPSGTAAFHTAAAQATAAAQQLPPATQTASTEYPAPEVFATPVDPYPGVGQTPETMATVEQTLPTEYPLETATTTATADDSSSLGVAGETVWGYRMLNEYPHDPLAYTQGLVVEQGAETLIESTGRESSLRRVDLETGEPLQVLELPDQYFGEGMTLFNDRIVQLTWKEQTGFVYDAKTFEAIGSFSYLHEGWGLTHDGSQFIVSDGTDVIRFWDPETFQETRTIAVKSLAGPVTMLNELEYVEGEIWANIWYSDLIARISPEDGRVLGWVDLTGIISQELRPDSQSVLNGIAYDSESGRLFVTGKNWPKLFEIEIVKSDSALSQ